MYPMYLMVLQEYCTAFASYPLNYWKVFFHRATMPGAPKNSA